MYAYLSSSKHSLLLYCSADLITSRQFVEFHDILPDFTKCFRLLRTTDGRIK